MASDLANKPTPCPLAIPLNTVVDICFTIKPTTVHAWNRRLCNKSVDIKSSAHGVFMEH
jgi:hypothetical protein